MTLNTPIGFETQVLEDWIGDDEILEQDEKHGTFCVLVKDESGNKRFIRFFLGGGTTQCSVDWDECWGSAEQRLFDIMFSNFTN